MLVSAGMGCACSVLDSDQRQLTCNCQKKKLEIQPHPVCVGKIFHCCTQYDQTRYLWHFFCQYHSFFALERISLCENTAAYYKLINYSVEVLKARLAKWLPINKTLWNQITLAIILLLSQFLKTGTNQCSICFPAELNRKTSKKKQL